MEQKYKPIKRWSGYDKFQIYLWYLSNEIFTVSMTGKFPRTLQFYFEIASSLVNLSNT